MESPVAVEETAASWWGRFQLALGEWGHWAVGPLDLWLRRLPSEWTLVDLPGSGAEDRPAAVSVPAPSGPGVPEEQRLRYVVGKTAETVVLTPYLADRSVVARPDSPLFILAGAEVCLYVSSPLWVRLETGEERRLLREMPVSRPSDTWFGPTTREGELAYAARTQARLDPDGLPPTPHWAITRVRLRNETRTPMPMERLNLPVPNLTLYEGGDGRLWTENVTLTLGPDSDSAAVVMEKAKPAEARRAKPLHEPRSRPERNRLVRALSSLIG
ncbi:hypothetical protein [Thiohalorhabdus methylotrophus]|uniref:DUF432 domain-containing protein n=1 Tax=Thiohalorhabdus methylotrophus TaxID=3242694 RepID=A0ABV4TW59_9GAMM